MSYNGLQRAFANYVNQDLQERMAAVKADMDILSVADLLDVSYPDHQLGQEVRFTCPVHGDGTEGHPTGMLYIDEGLWKCFDCGGGGTMFDLPISFGKAKTFPESLQWLEAHCGIATPRVESRKHSGGYPL
ncbi:hypothetical protein LCGC14_0993070 [marine sediment metagenome]|uniref:Zinc finger CHC2-type domain-containing protein n=1 Tax=marine sediment metagenome TaxID=412755 RepID=A0A0F9N9U3_9ZZZZ